MDRGLYSDMNTSVDRNSERMGFGGTETHTDINSRDSSQNFEDFMKRTEIMQAERERK